MSLILLMRDVLWFPLKEPFLLCQQFLLPLKAAEPWRRLLRREQFERVRIECQHHGRAGGLLRVADECGDHPLVSEVDAVEIANRNESRTVCRGVCEAALNVHRVVSAAGVSPSVVDGCATHGIVRTVDQDHKCFRFMDIGGR